MVETKPEGAIDSMPPSIGHAFNFQLSFPSRPMAGEGSFGHYGMGGSMAFAHPARGLAFGYTMNQMLSPSGPDPRSTALIQAVLRCAG